MPVWVITLLISLFVRLLVNEEFIRKFTLILLKKILAACEERGVEFLIPLLKTILDWLETPASEAVFKGVAQSFKNDKKTREEISQCVRRACK